MTCWSQGLHVPVVGLLESLPVNSMHPPSLAHRWFRHMAMTRCTSAAVTSSRASSAVSAVAALLMVMSPRMPSTSSRLHTSLICSISASGIRTCVSSQNSILIGIAVECQTAMRAYKQRITW